MEDFDIEDGVDINYIDDIADDEQFNNVENTDEEDDGQNLKRNAIIVAVICIILIIAAIFIWRFASSHSDSRKVEQEDENVEQVIENNNNTTAVNTATSSNDWVEISGEEEVENITEQQVMFTVTGIRHLAKKNGNEMQLKTELTGYLSGYSGTYILDVPYSKGKQLNSGMSFNVSISVGSYNNSIIVEEVYYK